MPTPITQMDFCLDHLEGLLRPGGESLLKSQLSDDPRRPLLTIDLIDDGPTGQPRGYVRGLNLQSGGTSVPSSCVEPGCLWETSLLYEPTNTTYYGPVDSNGFMYLVDVGYIYEACNQLTIVATSLPLTVDGYFEGPLLPRGARFIRLRQVTPYLDRVVLHHIALPLGLPRTGTGYLLNYDATDQVVDVEELCVGISSLLGATYYRELPNQQLSRRQHYRDPIISRVIASLGRLASLVDLDVTSPRYGSIPSHVATYSSAFNDSYGPPLDEHYLNRVISIVDDSCVDTDCLSHLEDQTLISRAVSSRAVAWLLYVGCSYLLTNRGAILFPVDAMANYLINQMDGASSLVRDGWTHSDTYGDSQQITSTGTPTSVMAMLALLGAYDLTLNMDYLEAASDIYEALLPLTSSGGLRAAPLQNPTTESNIYGLMFLLIGEAPLLENCVAALAHSLTPYVPPYEQYLITGTSQPIVDSVGNPLVVRQDNITYPYFQGSTNALRENVVSVVLLGQAHSQGYMVPYLEHLRALAVQVSSTYEQVRDQLSISYVASCVGSPSLGAPYHVDLLLSLPFLSRYLYRFLVSMLPVEYGWFSADSLLTSSPLGSLLMSFSRLLRRSRVQVLLNHSLGSLGRGALLDRWASQYSISRLPNETDESLSSRTTASLPRAITADSLTDHLGSLDFHVDHIEDHADRILTFGGGPHSGTTDPSTSYLSGTKYTATAYTLHCSDMPTAAIQEEVTNRRPAASTPYYLGYLTVLASPKSTPSSCASFTYSSFGQPPSPPPITPVLLLEDATPVLLETGESIPLEVGNQ